MQQVDQLPQHIGAGRLRLGLQGSIVAIQCRLDQFEIPVAEGTPGEVIQRASGLVELVGLQRRIDIAGRLRSEEHTSELQSRPHLVCRLLLEKKKYRIHKACYTP